MPSVLPTKDEPQFVKLLTKKAQKWEKQQEAKNSPINKLPSALRDDEKILHDEVEDYTRHFGTKM